MLEMKIRSTLSILYENLPEDVRETATFECIPLGYHRVLLIIYAGELILKSEIQ